MDARRGVAVALRGLLTHPGGLRHPGTAPPADGSAGCGACGTGIARRRRSQGRPWDDAVVSTGGASIELCGGTQVRRSGDIGLFKILSEADVGQGVRRIGVASAQARETARSSRSRGQLNISNNFKKQTSAWCPTPDHSEVVDQVASRRNLIAGAVAHRAESSGIAMSAPDVRAPIYHRLLWRIQSSRMETRCNST